MSSLTRRSTMCISENMTGNTIKLSGAIDRSDPDPASPSNPWRHHIGNLTVYWSEHGEGRRSMAGIIRDSSGRASSGPPAWRGSVLCLVWIGDPPPASIVQSAYDWVLDRGPDRGEFSTVVEVRHPSPTSASYRSLAAAAR